MTKSKNHIRHNRSQKRPQMASQTQSQRHEPLKREDSMYPRNMCFARKHKRSLKKIQVNSVKAASVSDKAIGAHVKPTKSKQTPQKAGGTSRFACTSQHKLKGPAVPTDKGLGLCQQRPRLKPIPRLQLWHRLSQVLMFPEVSSPTKTLE
ncbi:60S ribosomal protein L29 [Galemys pyrenaicus]|uniref:60S ribosomal protein L29 n=1 Tax=Galemys pyrenaicus TaxID=202257 RepID=A0A8J6AG91_GALPY|nr:60S ribosomal protein L29 [Galemys pyrenaicus]